MKIAFATTDGRLIDEHFGRAGMFAIYEITKEGYTFVELRRFSEGRDKAIEDTRGLPDVHEEKIEQKIDRLSDCKIVYITEIGGPSAARLTRRGIMPVKVKEPAEIQKILSALAETIKNSSVPWLKKALDE